MKWRAPGQEVDQRKLGDCGKRINTEDAMDCNRWRKQIRDYG